MDAAFFKNQNKTGIGLCIRDEYGHFIQARTSWMSPVMMVHEGETMGLLDALKWSLQLGLDRVIFELDANIVVDSIHNPKLDRT